MQELSIVDGLTHIDLLFMLEEDMILWAELSDDYKKYLSMFPDGTTCEVVFGQEGRFGKLDFSDHQSQSDIAIRFYEQRYDEEDGSHLGFVGTMIFNNIKAFKKIVYEELSKN